MKFIVEGIIKRQNEGKENEEDVIMQEVRLANFRQGHNQTAEKELTFSYLKEVA